MFHHGITLKTLLENPELLNPPKIVNNGSGHPEKKIQAKEVEGDETSFGGQSAFLGPNIWDKTLAYSDDFNLEYMDLDEFLNENGVSDEGLGINTAMAGSFSPQQQVSPNISPQHSSGQHMNPQNLSPQNLSAQNLSAQNLSPQNLSPQNLSPQTIDVVSVSPPPAKALIPNELEKHLSGQMSPNSPSEVSPGPICLQEGPESLDMCDDDSTSDIKQEKYPSSPVLPGFKMNPNELALATVPGQDFDPRKRAFSDEELRPQPMIKKSRKIYVPDDCKDEKYWCRRKKNNIAAKRSRDARRIKENQIALRASFLEKESSQLREELAKYKAENAQLKKRLAKYEGPQE